MKITIVLATCQPTNLSATLESLSRCTLPSCFARTIIIENGTPAKTLEDVVRLASPDLKISYMHCVEGNKSNALNVAIDSLQENQLLFLTDDDVQFDKDILLRYVEASKGHTTRRVYGGTIKPDSPAPPPSNLVPYIPSSMLGFPRPGTQRDLSKALFIGPNWAVFSDDVKALGGFDPRFGPGSKYRATGQESQMMLRMRDTGYEFEFIDSAVVVHKVEPFHYTEEFIVDRNFRGGIERGLRMNIENKKPSAFSLLKLQIKARLLALILPLLKLVCSRSTVIRLRIKSQQARGVLKGLSVET